MRCEAEVDGERCENEAREAGLCHAHYMQKLRGRPFSTPRTSPGDGTRVSVRMPAELFLQVQAAAEDEGVEVPEWIRDACGRKLGDPK